MKNYIHYESPDLKAVSMEFEGFLCSSIKLMAILPEVDEYQNMGTEDLVLE